MWFPTTTITQQQDGREYPETDDRASHDSHLTPRLTSHQVTAASFPLPNRAAPVATY
jgi:hypothetical protein